MANIYHWLTGSQTDLFSDIYLTASYGAQAVTGSSRYGSGSAWEIGTSTSSRSTLYSGYNATGPDALPNLGTGDITVAFWWKPNSSTFNGSGQRHLFQYSPGAALEVYHNASLSSDTESDYNLVAQYRYGDGSTSHSRTYRLNLSQVDGEYPWIKIYASRISGVFYFNLYNADGNDLTDKDGGATTWSESGYSNQIYNASGSSPHIRIGGDFAYGQTAGGIYDDIFLTLDHGILAGDLELDSDGYAKIDPVVNSFSTSDTSVANSGDTATLSWDTDFNTSTQLLKYVGGLLSDTETVTGSSKQVTITETVSYKLRTTNIYGSVDSEMVEIQLSNGGNEMAVGNNGNNPGLVIQKNHVRAKGDLAGALKVNGGGVLDDVVLNDGLSSLLSQDASLATAFAAADTAEASSRLSGDVSVALSGAQADASIEVAFAAADTVLSGTMNGADLSHRAILDAADTSIVARFSTADSAEASSRLSGDVSVTTAFTAADTVLSGTMNGADLSHRAALESAISVGDSTEASRRVSGDASVVVVLSEADSVVLSSANSLDTSLETALITALSQADSVVLSKAVSLDASVVTRMEADDATLSAGVSGELSSETSSRISADTSLTTADTSLTTRLSSEESTRASADASLAARAGVVWDASNRTLDIGDNVEFVFEDYSGFSVGDAIQMEIKYKNA